MATIDSPSALLRVVGDGPIEDELRRLCNDLGLGDRVEFTGYRSPAELEGIYAASDIFVLSTHSEAFANVVLEAMSWGLPVVSTRVGGCPEVIDDGFNGLLVEPGDIPAMANAITRLLDDAELRRSFGARNRERIRSSFSWMGVAAEYEMLYEEVVRLAPRRQVSLTASKDKMAR
jgi:glycosyltransferase involved in cell wall biosynthesis